MRSRGHNGQGPSITLIGECNRNIVEDVFLKTTGLAPWLKYTSFRPPWASSVEYRLVPSPLRTHTFAGVHAHKGKTSTDAAWQAKVVRTEVHDLAAFG